MQPSFLSQLAGIAEGVRYALVVSGSPLRTAPALISELACSASLIVAVDSGADVVRAAGLVPDLLLGDFDSASPETLAYYQASNIEVMRYDPHKDATDIELALELVRERGFSKVIITNALGGRLDHELATLGCLAAASKQGMAVSVIEESQACVFLSSEVDKGKLTMGTVPLVNFISLIPWGGDAVVTATGLEWELDHATLKPSSSRGVSNVPTGDCPSIEVHQGTLLIILQY